MDVNQHASTNVCPACGPVPSWSTSCYCRHHVAELWLSYVAMRATKPTPLARPTGADREVA